MTRRGPWLSITGRGRETAPAVDIEELADRAPASGPRPAGPPRGRGRATAARARADRGGEPQVVRRQQDRDAALRVEAPQQRGHFELVPQIQRRRRFVEQQDAVRVIVSGPRPHAGRSPLPRASLRSALAVPWAPGLCPSAVSSCASADAMTTRCFSPPLSVRNGRSANAAVPVAWSAAIAAARSAGPSTSNVPRCG